MTNTFKLNKELVGNLPNELSNKTNLDLVNSFYTTNRLLEIPQDIKLELNNGTLTLKAGSKVYVPNGFESDGTTPKFDVVMIENDINGGQSGTSNNVAYLRSNTGNSMISVLTSSMYSGNEEPSGTTYAIWYDTANNKIGLRTTGSSTFVFGFSFPICVATISESLVTSIDQIFNGFGYIGSTVFALPGVKLQQATGFDGNTPTSEIQIISSVSAIQSAGNNGFYDGYLLYTNSTLHSRNVGHLSFDANKNLVIDDEYPSYARGIVLYYYSTDSTGRIKTFNTASTDSITNSNASNFSQAGRSYLCGIGMPSSRYIDLTLGASGSTYVAPANGWVYIKLDNHSGWTQLRNESAGKLLIAAVLNAYAGMYLPVKRGQIFQVEHPGDHNISDSFTQREKTNLQILETK